MSTTSEKFASHPLRTKPWPGRGLLGADEKAAVDALFDEAIATREAFGYNGPQESAYCEEFAAAMGGGYADGVNSGTTAVYVALRALDIDAFSEVIVGAVTDPGGFMPIPLQNCIPFVADCTPDSYNTGPAQIEELITARTRAIVVAHIGGEPADMVGIMRLAAKHRLLVVEDCAQAHGATLNGQPVGTFGHIAAFSTMFGKHHCTGGQGGVVFTRDAELFQRVRWASDRGKPFGLSGATHQIAALNLNLNDLAATIGRVQLKKLPHIVQRRRELVAKLGQGLRDIPCVSLPKLLPGANASYWFVRLRFHPDRVRCDKDTYLRAAQTEGLTPVASAYSLANPHRAEWFVKRRVFANSSYPWSSPDYHGERDRPFPCPNTLALSQTDFNLYLHEGWGEEEIQDVLAIFRKVMNQYAK